MQSMGSSSLLEPGDCKTSAGSMFGGGVVDGPVTVVRVALFDFLDCVAASLASLASTRWSISGVARMVSPRRILCLPDCLCLRVETIR
jgi:hypothetical protein